MFLDEKILENNNHITTEQVEYLLKNRSIILNYIKYTMENQSKIIQEAEEMCSSYFLASSPISPVFSEKTGIRDVYDELEEFKRTYRYTVRDCTKTINNLRMYESITHRVYGCFCALPGLRFVQEHQILECLYIKAMSWDDIVYNETIFAKSKKTISTYKQRALYLIKLMYETEYNVSDFYLPNFDNQFCSYLLRKGSVLIQSEEEKKFYNDILKVLLK